MGQFAVAYTDAGRAGVRGRIGSMVDTRIKPYAEQQAEKAAREEQRRQFRRNQVFGLLLIAAAIVAWWLVHTDPRWIAPPGWWRP